MMGQGRGSQEDIDSYTLKERFSQRLSEPEKKETEI